MQSQVSTANWHSFTLQVNETVLQGQKSHPCECHTVPSCELTSLTDCCLHGINLCHRSELPCGRVLGSLVWPSGVVQVPPSPKLRKHVLSQVQSPLSNPSIFLRNSALFGGKCFQGSVNESCCSALNSGGDREVDLKGTKMWAWS